MTREELSRYLAHHTSLVLSVANGELPPSDFIEAYGNFYYSYALDGHESDSEELQVLKEQQDPIEFHRKVQEEILNLVYLDDDPYRERRIRVGRIDLEQARARLTELCEKQGAEEILRKLDE